MVIHTSEKKSEQGDKLLVEERKNGRITLKYHYKHQKRTKLIKLASKLHFLSETEIKTRLQKQNFNLNF